MGRSKDLEQCTNAANGMQKNVERGVGGKEKKFEYDTLRKVQAVLEAGQDVRSAAWDGNEIPILNTYQFLTAKPMIYLVNLRVRSFIHRRSNWLPQIIEYVNAKGLQ